MRKMDNLRLPQDLDYSRIPGLTREAVEKLVKYSPQTIGEAKKIPGLTPATILNLYVYLRLLKKREAALNVPRGTSSSRE